MPVYPLPIAPLIAADVVYPWLIVVQSLLDATLVWLAYAIAVELFDRRVGLVAAIGTALSPYGVMHASSFQETVVFNVLMAVGIYLLITAGRSATPIRCLAGGTALSLATLTTVRMALFLPLAVIWVAASGRNLTPLARVTRAALVVTPMLVLLGSWAIRNERLIGAPVLSTESGLSLWIANNPLTMTVLPHQTVDLIEDRAYTALGAEERQALAALARDPLALDAYYARLGWNYIITQPVATLMGGVEKALFGSIGWLTPARDWPIQLGYALIYVPLNVLALVGLWRARPGNGPHALITLLVVSFVITTGVFWAHTSHRSFLHVFEMIYAASALAPVLGRTRFSRAD